MIAEIYLVLPVQITEVYQHGNAINVIFIGITMTK